MTYNMT